MTFLVSLDRASDQDITVDYATSDGTGSDAATAPRRLHRRIGHAHLHRRGRQRLFHSNPSSTTTSTTRAKSSSPSP